MGVRPTEMGNNRIRNSDFLNQNSPAGACFEKVFLSLGPKKVLQQIRSQSGQGGIPPTSVSEEEKNVETEYIAGFEVDHQLVLGRGLDGKPSLRVA
jgi:hypothetical protein